MSHPISPPPSGIKTGASSGSVIGRNKIITVYLPAAFLALSSIIFFQSRIHAVAPESIISRTAPTLPARAQVIALLSSAVLHTVPPPSQANFSTVRPLRPVLRYGELNWRTSSFIQRAQSWHPSKLVHFISSTSLSTTSLAPILLSP